MKAATKIGYEISGFTLGLLTIILIGFCLHFIFSSVWAPSHSILVAYGVALVIAVIAIASTWICLLMSLRNKAMIRGVWCQIYVLVCIAAVGLIVTLFW